ncbi:MAG: hypothetical protein AABX00_05920 [Nanoarchaeota archaeon]
MTTPNVTTSDAPSPYGRSQDMDYVIKFGHLLRKYTPEQRTLMFVFDIKPGTEVDFGELERAVNESESNPTALSAAEAQRLSLLKTINWALSKSIIA